VHGANNLISGFVIQANGVTFDFTNDANSPAVNAACTSSPGSAAITFAYLSGSACGPRDWRYQSFQTGPTTHQHEFYLGNLFSSGFQLGESVGISGVAFGASDRGSFTVSAMPVPEPQATTLLLTGATLLAWRRRKAGLGARRRCAEIR
jgi:hypothetical protein